MKMSTLTLAALLAILGFIAGPFVWELLHLWWGWVIPWIGSLILIIAYKQGYTYED